MCWQRDLEETNGDVSTSAVKSFSWPVFLQPWEPCKSQPCHPLCRENHLHQHPLWPGRAELRGAQGDRAPGMMCGVHRRKIDCLPLIPSPGCLSEQVRPVCHGQVYGRGGWMAPTVTSPCAGQAQQCGEQARHLSCEPAGKPETLPAVPSFHQAIPLSPLASSQPPSSDAARAVTALSPHGRTGDRPLRLAFAGRQ